MKKISKMLSLALAATLLTGTLAACSTNTTTTAANTTTTPNAETTAPPTDAPTDAPTEAPTDAPSTGLTGNVNVYTRDSSSGTRGAFEELIGFEGELVATASETSGNGDMATKVGQDANGIGYVSLTTDFAANNLKPLAFHGVEPSEATVLDGAYNLKRPFAYVTRAEGDFASDEVEQLVAAFIDYLVNSTEGREVVSAEGGIADVASGTSWDELKANHPIVDQDNSGLELRTGGSTSVEKTLKAALESFVPLAGNFTFVMDQTGSGDGFKRTLGGEKDGANAADIGFASRDFKTDGTEDVSTAMESGVYCQDAVVVVVEANNPVSDLTEEQVYDLFTGAVSKWEDLA